MTRLDSLVEKLLSLSRSQSAQGLFERAPLQVDDVVSDALAAFEAVRLGQPVTLKVEVEQGLELLGDRAALAQALANLLVNAWKYTPKDKQIGLRATSADRRIEIAVSDNGPGISSDEQRRIFEAFERGRAAELAGTPGSGLGLSIVRAVVEAHHGKLELSSTPNHGSCFRVLLPRHTAHAS
jgi:signal transduction histidine kinase